MENEKLLTVKELAEYLSVKVSTIYKYTHQGMPCETKKPLRFKREDCLEWLKQR